MIGVSYPSPFWGVSQGEARGVGQVRSLSFRDHSPHSTFGIFTIEPAALGSSGSFTTVT
jgi:hypothetical protein